MKHIIFFLTLLSINLSAQTIHTYEDPEAWRDEDLRVPHRFIPVTLMEAVNVVQHKAPYLLASNNIRKPQLLEKEKPVYIYLPSVIPIVRDTVDRVDTLEKVIYIDRVDTIYTRGQAAPARIIRQVLHDTVQNVRTEYVTKTEYASSPFDIALRVCVVLMSLGIAFPSLLNWWKS